MNKKGFTIIEVLVVTAIVTIQIAVLFPAFHNARDNSNQRNCVSNLRHVAKAALLYARDNDDKLPPCYFESAQNRWRAPLDWYSVKYSLLNPYMKNYYRQICPSAPEVSFSGYPPAASYGMNATVFGMPVTFFSSNPRLLVALQKPPVLSSIAKPRRTIMFMCMFPLYGYIFPSTETKVPAYHAQSRWLGRNVRPYDPTMNPGEGLVTGVDTAWHRNGSNFAFVDGHVKWFKVHTPQIDSGEWWDLN